MHRNFARFRGAVNNDSTGQNQISTQLKRLPSQLQQLIYGWVKNGCREISSDGASDERLAYGSLIVLTPKSLGPDR
jgi:hypothetical protein